MKKKWILMDAGDTFIYGYPTLYQAIQDCFRNAGQDLCLDGIKETLHGLLKTEDRIALTDQAKFENYLKEIYRSVLQFYFYPGEIETGVNWLWGEWRSGKRLRLFDDACAALEKLKRAGFYLGIVSNWDNTLEGILDRLGVHSLFDIVLASCQVHIAKPDLRIFTLALHQAGATAEETWFLGDQADMDIIPAKQLGMKTIYIDYYRNHKADVFADYYTASMSEAAILILQECKQD